MPKLINLTTQLSPESLLLLYVGKQIVLRTPAGVPGGTPLKDFIFSKLSFALLASDGQIVVTGQRLQVDTMRERGIEARVNFTLPPQINPIVYAALLMGHDGRSVKINLPNFVDVPEGETATVTLNLSRSGGVAKTHIVKPPGSDKNLVRRGLKMLPKATGKSLSVEKEE